jgi:hypothetical protein
MPFRQSKAHVYRKAVKNDCRIMKNYLFGISPRIFPNYLKCSGCDQYYNENHARLDHCTKLKDIWERFDELDPANDDEIFSPQRLVRWRQFHREHATLRLVCNTCEALNR